MLRAKPVKSYKLLGVNTYFRNWFPRVCEYGFEEGKDFRPILGESTGGRPGTDYQITVEMAKEICILQRTDAGRKLRRYLIELENNFNSPEYILSRALKVADKKLKEVTQQNTLLLNENNEMKPKAEFYDDLVAHGDAINFRNTAKSIGIGEKQLIALLIKRKYIYRDYYGIICASSAGIKKGFFVHKTWKNKDRSGQQVLVTPKGVAMCNELVKKYKGQALI